MAVTDRVRHAKRYAEVARLLVKHARPDEPTDGAVPEDAKELANELEAMGPTFIKLGQLLSTRTDLLPPELALLGKALLNLDQIAHLLAPGFDPSVCVQEHANEVIRMRMRPNRNRLAATALESREFIEELPGRMNRLLDAVVDGELNIKVDAIDQDELLRGIRLVANRVTMGLLLAALIIGAAMLARVDSTIATICFVAAAAGAFWLVAAIAIEGFRQRR